MLQPYVKLVSPTDVLVLDALDGWGILNIDLGDATTRDHAEDAPDSDGTLDFTTFTGSRVITLGLELVEFTQTIWQMVTRLRGFTRLRVPLEFQVQLDDNSPMIAADIRRSQFSNPLSNIWVQHPVIQWVAPTGVFRSVTPKVATVLPGTSGSENGRAYDAVWDRVYPASPILGSGTAVNDGNSEAFPIIRIYGPCTDPILRNDTQNKTFTFVGITIFAGEYLEIDTRAKTILYLGNIADSRYSKLSFAASTWWNLDPGVNQIRFQPVTSGPGSVAELTFFDTYL